MSKNSVNSSEEYADANEKDLPEPNQDSDKKSTISTLPYQLIPQKHETIDYMKSDKPFVVARFMYECGNKLNAKVLRVSTALQFLHRFSYKAVQEVYDPYLISAACFYLAGKVEDNDHLRLRDIINVVYTTLHPGRYKLLIVIPQYDRVTTLPIICCIPNILLFISGSR